MRQLYLDHASTTPIDEKVLKKFTANSKKYFANPSSQHSIGKEAREEFEKAREKIANFINADPKEIIFTSGGTEGNNLAIKGLAKANPEKKHIITSKIEHPCILETCKSLEAEGYTVDYLDVNEEGFVDMAQLEEKITSETLVVSIMFVNNEIGTIQDIGMIAEICHEKDVPLHTDGVQAFGKLDVDVKELDIDLMTVSGHKINAPKGIGFLYVKKGTMIKALLNGGSQERNLRSGTENYVSAIALADALDIKRNKEGIKKTRDKLIEGIKKIEGSKINGSLRERIYNNLNVSFYGIEGESIMLFLDGDGILVSTGSACNSAKLQESHVLKAIGVDEMHINGSIRMSIDELSDGEVDYILTKLKEAVKRLREISPFKIKNE